MQEPPHHIHVLPAGARSDFGPGAETYALRTLRKSPLFTMVAVLLSGAGYRRQHGHLHRSGLRTGAGSLTGGWLSGHPIGRGWNVNRSRKIVILAGMALMSAGILAAMAHGTAAALALIGVVLFGFQSWIDNVQTMPSDFFSEGVVASVAGLGGVGAGVGAILFTLATGFVVDRFRSYTPILVTAGLLPVAGTAALFLLGGPIQKVWS